MPRSVSDAEYAVYVAGRHYALCRNAGDATGSAWKALDKAWRTLIHEEAKAEQAAAQKLRAGRAA